MILLYGETITSPLETKICVRAMCTLKGINQTGKPRVKIYIWTSNPPKTSLMVLINHRQMHFFFYKFRRNHNNSVYVAESEIGFSLNLK